MALKQPNTICKNRNCHNGEDGGRKHYYSCLYCARTENWRSVACSWDCYLAYQEQVAEARRKDEPVNLLPERTDMTKDQVETMIHEMSVDEVMEQTLLELAEEIEANPDMGFGELVDLVNEQLQD